MKNETIAVVMGGPSKEGAVSLRTGKAILVALQEKGYNAVGVELEPERLKEQLEAVGATVVFNAVHGLFGEDGRLQGFCDMMGIPYTGGGVLSNAIAMDKAYSKRIFKVEGVPSANYMIIDKDEADNAVEQVVANFTFPVVVKAAAQGSSIGVSIVQGLSELQTAITDAFTYGQEVLIEEYIAGKELTVGILKSEGVITPLPVIQIVPHSGAYDFHSKYTVGATDYLVPAPITEEEKAVVVDAAIQAYKALACDGIARADVILADGKPYVLEVNTVPGMTATSLVPKAAAAIGIDFTTLCEMILYTARK